MTHTDAHLDDLLRGLDPAAPLTDDDHRHADRLLERIVATPPALPHPGTSPARVRRRRRGLAAAALGALGAVAVPVLLTGGGTAYATWTPTPERLDAALADVGADTCRSALEIAQDRTPIAVAERRGAWAYLLLAGTAGGAEAMCLMPVSLLDDGATVGGGLFFGSYSTDVPAPTPVAPDGLEEYSSTQGSTDEGWLMLVEGLAGRDVVGVTVTTSSGRSIEASLTQGRYAAWWPAQPPSSENPTETWSYTLRLADGTRRTLG